MSNFKRWRQFLTAERSHSVKKAVRETLRRVVMYPSAWLFRRLHPRVAVIGITGSAVKTTTKDICTTLLSEFGPCVKTAGSINSRLAVAQTLLKIRRRHRYAVLEMAVSKPGQLDWTVKMARPTVGVLTIIGRDHYSAFRSLEAIAEEKSKVITGLPKDGIVVLNIDDPLIRAIGEHCRQRLIWVGRGEGATLRLLEATSSWPRNLTLTVEYEGAVYQVPTRLHGEHFALPVLAALGVALALDIPLQRAIEAVGLAEPVEARMQIVMDGQGVAFVRDDWKAPHWSIDAPFDFMASATARRKIVVVGSISDSSLSPAKRYHRIAVDVKKIADIAVFIGADASKALKARTGPDDSSIQAFYEIQSAAEFLDSILQEGDLVLLKGTNKQDHLIRLILNRNSPISCWKSTCGRTDFCDQCVFLNADQPSGDKVFFPAGEDVGGGLKGWRANQNGLHLVVGLGNPGSQYVGTPHNIGYAVLERLAESLDGTWEKGPEGSVCHVGWKGASLVLFKPNVLINHSGKAIGHLLERYQGRIGSCLVVHDDMDLGLGMVKFRENGGPGGHNGIHSIINALRTDEFERIRIGGRRIGDERRTIDLVLTKYSDEDQVILSKAIERAIEMLVARFDTLGSGSPTQGSLAANE